jgi:hypothetical protein
MYIAQVFSGTPLQVSVKLELGGWQGLCPGCGGGVPVVGSWEELGVASAGLPFPSLCGGVCSFDISFTCTFYPSALRQAITNFQEFSFGVIAAERAGGRTGAEKKLSIPRVPLVGFSPCSRK